MKLVGSQLLPIVLLAATALPFRAEGQTSDGPFRREILELQAGATYSKLVGASNFGFRYDYEGRGTSSYLPFDNLGSGWGLDYGVSLQDPLSERLGIVARIRIFDLQTTSQETATRKAQPEIHGVPTATTATWYAKLWTFSGADLLLRYNLPPRFYLLGGLGFSVLANDQFNATQQILSAGSYPTDWNPMSPKQLVLTGYQSNAYYNDFRADLRFGIGTLLSLPFTNSALLAPEISVGIPFLHLFTSGVESDYANSGTRTPNLFYVAFTLGVGIPLGDGISPTEPTPVMIASRATTPQAHEPSPRRTDSATIAGSIKDESSGAPLKAALTATDLTNGIVVARLQSDSAGAYTLKLPAPGRYSLTAEAEGHLFHTVPLTLDSGGHHSEDISSLSLSDLKGRTPLLIFFGFNNANLAPESYPELLRVVALLTQQSQLNIELDGHTDSEGSDEYNQSLSERRADAARQFLLTHGISLERVTVKGFGRTKPVATNTTDEGRTKNRRVEMVVR